MRKGTRKVTRDSLQAMLDDPRGHQYVQHVVGRALVVLMNNQTHDEMRQAHTLDSNGIGFTGADAHSGTLTAKYYIKHHSLQEWQVERWTRRGRAGYSRLAKYHRQLNDAAHMKELKEMTT